MSILRVTWSVKAGIVAAFILTLGTERAAQAAGCPGDCGGDGRTDISELILGVNIALDVAPVSQCTAFDVDDNGRVTVSELVSAVSSVLADCFSPVLTSTVAQGTPAPTPTATPNPTCASNDGTAAVTASAASPASGNGTLQGSCVTVENAGGTRTELTRVRVEGTVGSQHFDLLVYFVTATGAIDTVTYEWENDPQFPGAFRNVAFCNGAACTGASMSLATGVIRLTNTALAGPFGESATLNGTITLFTVPTPAATATPLTCPGGSVDLSFANVQGTNNALPLTDPVALRSATNFSAASTFSAEFTDCPRQSPGRTLTFSVGGMDVAAGATYQIGLFPPLLNQLQYREDVGFNFREWNARSGTITIDAIDGSGRITFRVIDADMRQSTNSTGSFTLDAAGTLNPGS